MDNEIDNQHSHQTYNQANWIARVIIGIIVIVIVGGGFYWVAIRPGMIRKSCSNTAYSEVNPGNGYTFTRAQVLYWPGLAQEYNNYYSACLSSKGL
jgi:hypothetical protein